jgi:hypothetical protein
VHQQVIPALRRLRHRSDLSSLAADARIDDATGHRYLHEALDATAEEVPDAANPVPHRSHPSTNMEEEMAINVTDNFFEFGNQKYFRGNAHLVRVGTYGEKKDRIGARAYLDPQNNVRSEHLGSRLKTGTVATVDWSRTNKASVEVNGPLKVYGLNGKVDVRGTYEKARSAHLKLANFYILEGPLTVMLNKDADGARRFLADQGNDGRFVSESWIVVEAELAAHFAMHGEASLAVRAAGSDLAVTVTGGKHGAQTVKISPKTTFAYKLHKVKKWNNGKTRVEEMEADYKSIG